jgi:hypothetical protein
VVRVINKKDENIPLDVKTARRIACIGTLVLTIGCSAKNAQTPTQHLPVPHLFDISATMQGNREDWQRFDGLLKTYDGKFYNTRGYAVFPADAVEGNEAFNGYYRLFTIDNGDRPQAPMVGRGKQAVFPSLHRVYEFLKTQESEPYFPVDIRRIGRGF